MSESELFLSVNYLVLGKDVFHLLYITWMSIGPVRVATGKVVVIPHAGSCHIAAHAAVAKREC